VATVLHDGPRGKTAAPGPPGRPRGAHQNRYPRVGERSARAGQRLAGSKKLISIGVFPHSRVFLCRVEALARGLHISVRDGRGAAVTVTARFGRMDGSLSAESPDSVAGLAANPAVGRQRPGWATWPLRGQVRRRSSIQFAVIRLFSARSRGVCVMTAWSATTAAVPRFRPPAEPSLRPLGPWKAREGGSAPRAGGCESATCWQPQSMGLHAPATAAPAGFRGRMAALRSSGGRSGRPAAHPLSHQCGEGITTVVNHHCGEALTEPVTPAFSAEIPDPPCVPPRDSHSFSLDSLSPSRGRWRFHCERTSE